MHVTPQMLYPLIAIVVVVAFAIVIVWRLRGANAKSARQQAAEVAAQVAFEEMSMLSFKLRKQLKDQGIEHPEEMETPLKPLTELYPGPKPGGSTPKP
jgi:type II secretory pathway pseudopilin PulG